MAGFSAPSDGPPQALQNETGVRINEISISPNPQSREWVELKNAGDQAVSINNYLLSDQDGVVYQFPGSLPPVPAGDFVLVVFDGLGSSQNDTDFSDHLITLHSEAGYVDVLEEQHDFLGLYRASSNQVVYLPFIFTADNPLQTSEKSPSVPDANVISFLAWGAAPNAAASEAAAAGLWHETWYIGLTKGMGFASTGNTIGKDESLGLLPGSAYAHPNDWELYQASEATPGAENVYPAISWFDPPPGSEIDGETFTVIWMGVPGASGYHFQLAGQTDFNAPLIDAVLDQPVYTSTLTIPAGDYYWRVKALFPGGASAWTPGNQIRTYLAAPFTEQNSPEAAAIVNANVLGIQHKLQRKDTRMLCLAGDPELGSFAWNHGHFVSGIHGRNYCVRASVAMVNSYYGGTLSQDRLSYEIFGGAGPEKDLGHDLPMSSADVSQLLSWALGTSEITHQTGKPPFEQFKEWIDAGRPVTAGIPGHLRVIDGYRETILGENVIRQELHILDPAAQAVWRAYASDPIQEVWVSPSGVSDARSDEDHNANGTPDTFEDSDQDGVVDFDEIYRFPDLSSAKKDSDADGILDLFEIREYVFNNEGEFSPRSADIDGDGQRKEADADNDGGGAPDGCEDINYNGMFEPDLNETDNFNRGDERECLCLPGFIPNETPGSHTFSGATDAITGTIAPETDVDYFYFHVPDSGNLQIDINITDQTTYTPGTIRRMSFTPYYPDGTTEPFWENLGSFYVSILGEPPEDSPMIGTWTIKVDNAYPEVPERCYLITYSYTETSN